MIIEKVEKSHKCRGSPNFHSIRYPSLYKSINWFAHNNKIIKIANIFFNLSVLFTKNFGRKIAVKKHIDVIFKPKVGKFIKSICFNSLNTQLGKYLLTYKKNVHVIAQIHLNYWNNKKVLQLNIKDLFIELN